MVAPRATTTIAVVQEMTQVGITGKNVKATVFS